MTRTSLPASSIARATGYATAAPTPPPTTTTRPRSSDVGRHAERPHDVGKLVAHLEMRELVRGLAHAHEDEAHPAFLGRPVRERQRDALAVLVDAQHEELARAALGRDARCLDAHLPDGVGELSLVDDREHVCLRGCG